MPILKEGAQRLTTAQIKSAQVVKEGVSVLSATPDDSTQANYVAQAIVEALPDRRALEANRLRQLMLEPGGKVVVWDQLLRTRKPGGTQAGLVALVEMLGAKADKFQALGQEPASLILSAMCSRNEQVLVISKQRKILRCVLIILGDANSTDVAKRNASWILRRMAEVSQKIRIELGTDREALQLLGKIMRCEPVGVEQHDLDTSAEAMNTRNAGNISRAASVNRSVSTSPYIHKRTESGMSVMSVENGMDSSIKVRSRHPNAFQENHGSASEANFKNSSGAHSSSAWSGGSESFANRATPLAHPPMQGSFGVRPSTAEHTRFPNPTPPRGSTTPHFRPSSAETTIPSLSERPPLPGDESFRSSQGHMPKASVHGSFRQGDSSTSGGTSGMGTSFKTTRTSTMVSDSFRAEVHVPESGSFNNVHASPHMSAVNGHGSGAISTLGGHMPSSHASFRSSRPRTAGSSAEVYFRGSSRPATALGVQTGTLQRETDAMCVQGNVCCAIGNTCYSDEVIDRVGKTDGVLTGVLYLLDCGTEWAAGHAARTLGNLTYSMENCKHLVTLDETNIAIRAIMDMITCHNSSLRSKELAVHALSNICRSTTMCVRLNGFPGVYEELNRLAQEGVPQQDIDRAITNISQARLGTRTWRQPKRL